MTHASHATQSAVQPILLAEDAPSLRRWIFAALVVVLVHAVVVFWLLYTRDLYLAGEPPAAIMIELAPVDVAPPSETPPAAVPGPRMTEAHPEEESVQPQAIPVPELTPAPKPNVVLMPPRKPKPKKIVKEVQKPVAKAGTRTSRAAD